MSQLVVSGLKAYYFTEKCTLKAVDGVNFGLSANESMGIVGESACGKSSLGATIIRSIASPGKLVEGAIVLDGLDITKMRQAEFNQKIRWKKISMVFQGAMNTLDPVYSVGTQLREVLREHGFKGETNEKITKALESVGLDSSVAAKYPHELSGGMKQRVVIAMAILLEPDLLIADEPTTALDVLVQKKVVELLKKLKQEKGMRIILITHDLALVSTMVDKIGIMYAGQLVEVGSVEDIYKTPRHPYTQDLIKAIPRLRSKEKKIHSIPGQPPGLCNPPDGCRYFDRCSHATEICKKPVPDFATHSGYVKCWLYADGQNN